MKEEITQIYRILTKIAIIEAINYFEPVRISLDERLRREIFYKLVDKFCNNFHSEFISNKSSRSVFIF